MTADGRNRAVRESAVLKGFHARPKLRLAAMASTHALDHLALRENCANKQVLAV